MEQLFGRFDTPTDKYGVCKIVTVGGAYRSSRSRREIRSCLLQSLGTIARGVDTLASVKLLGSGGVVYRQAAWRLICVVTVFLLVQISGGRRTMPSGLPSLWWSKGDALQPRAASLVHDTAITAWARVTPALATVSGCTAISSTTPHIPLGSCPT